MPYDLARSDLLDKVGEIVDLSNLNSNEITNILIFGSSFLNNASNKSIIEITIEYLIRSGRFEGPLF